MLPDQDESTLADIAKRMGVRSNYASQYKSRLLLAGIIEERGRGYAEIVVSGFKEYLLRKDNRVPAP